MFPKSLTLVPDVPTSDGDRSVRAPVVQSTRVRVWVGNAAPLLGASVFTNSNQRPLADADQRLPSPSPEGSGVLASVSKSSMKRPGRGTAAGLW